jgi:anti-sigma-K factor RskA
MNYDNPRLRAMLAGEYVLGIMPRRARARFERLMMSDPAPALLVDRWAACLASLDAATPPEVPPARVWQAILARLPAPSRAAPRHRHWSFAWRRDR